MEEELKLSTERKFQCSICCNDIEQGINIFQMESCSCQYCIECVRQYCVTQLDTCIEIRCPNIKCNSFLSTNEVCSLLDNSQYNLYNKRLLDLEVTNDPQRLFCPQVDCDQILTLPNDQHTYEHQQQPVTCTKCQHTFCLNCRCQWHPSQCCVESLISNEFEGQSNIKRCPRCRFPLQWIEGCAQIICVHCKHMFCWYCLKSLDNDLFLLHYEHGPCRNRLGHTRTSVFFHRLTILGLFIVFIVLVIIASPLLIFIVPCLICYRYKRIKNYLNNLIESRRSPRQQILALNQSLVNIEHQPMTLSLSASNTDI